LSLDLVLPYPPSLNALYRTLIKGTGKQARAMPVKSAEYRGYEQQIFSALERRFGGAGPRIIAPRLVAVTANVYRPRAIGDLDNTFKALLDCLSGKVYEDDGQIVELHAYRHDSKERPRVELVVSEVAPFTRQGSLL
jgi:Holliday junction resolvase RusA-like endonuclease